MEVINLDQQSVILIKYLYCQLELGNTSGINEEEYITFLNNFINKLNRQGNNITYKNETFSKIVKNLEKILETYDNKETLKYNSENNTLIPTYNTTENINLYYNYSNILSEYINKELDLELKCLKVRKLNNLNKCRIEKDKLLLESAKKVGAFYINNLLDIYIAKLIEEKKWPIQYKDIDKYIFDCDLAKIIGQNITKENCTLSYLNTIYTISEILSENENKIIISNNKNNLLAYSNFIKLTMNEEVSFLQKCEYNPRSYSKPNIELIAIIDNDSITYQRSYNLYDYWDGDVYHHIENREIDDKEIKIMKKRINF